MKDYNKLITDIYKEYNSTKISEVPFLLQKYQGNEEELYQSIYNKYVLAKTQKTKVIILIIACLSFINYACAFIGGISYLNKYMFEIEPYLVLSSRFLAPLFLIVFMSVLCLRKGIKSELTERDRFIFMTISAIGLFLLYFVYNGHLSPIDYLFQTVLLLSVFLLSFISNNNSKTHESIFKQLKNHSISFKNWARLKTWLLSLLICNTLLFTYLNLEINFMYEDLKLALYIVYIVNLLTLYILILISGIKITINKYSKNAFRYSSLINLSLSVFLLVNYKYDFESFLSGNYSISDYLQVAASIVSSLLIFILPFCSIKKA